MSYMTNDEFNRIYNAYYKLLLHVAFDYLNSKNDAEDVIQEVFMKLYESRKQFNDDEHLKYWLVKVTNNKCIDHLRHIKNKEMLISNDHIDILNNQDNKEDSLQRRVQEAIDKLNINDKTIIVLYYYNDLSLKEISKVLSISEVNVKKRISRARIKLKSIIGDKNE